jgi:FAD dependent monooxygenase
MASPRPFTAIIIGGSVAGLTLAHMFSRAKINYILLEGRDSLAPQLGTGIVIMPNGCRVLDQMGLLEGMRGHLTPMGQNYRRKRNGEVVGETDWPARVTKR